MKTALAMISAAALIAASGSAMAASRPHETGMPRATTQQQTQTQMNQGTRQVMPVGTTTDRRVNQDRVQDNPGGPRASSVPEATTQSTQPPVAPAQN